MSIQVRKKFVSMVLKEINSSTPTVSFVDSNASKPNDDRLLCLYNSCTAPLSVPLVASPVAELKPFQICKVDWHFGVCCHRKDREFNWLDELRDERSLSIQMVVETPSDVEFAEVYTDMMGLQPLNQTLDPKPDFLKVATEAAIAVSPWKILSAVLESLGSERERVKATEEAQKLAHRFLMYRFVDGQGRRGIEWLLAKDVISDWGSLLRGSAYLVFYGCDEPVAPASKQGVPNERHATITVCPHLGFLEGDHLCYVPGETPDELAVRAEVGLSCGTPE